MAYQETRVEYVGATPGLVEVATHLIARLKQIAVPASAQPADGVLSNEALDDNDLGMWTAWSRGL